MSEDKKYNGWTNYETWAVKLWLDNEENSANYWNEAARDAIRAEPSYAEYETANSKLAERLKTEVEECAPELEGLYADLLNAALSEVDWYEIAEHYVRDNRPVEKA